MIIKKSLKFLLTKISFYSILNMRERFYRGIQPGETRVPLKKSSPQNGDGARRIKGFMDWGLPKNRAGERERGASLCRKPGSVFENWGNPGETPCALTFWCTNMNSGAKLRRRPDPASKTGEVRVNHIVHSKSGALKAAEFTGQGGGQKMDRRGSRKTLVQRDEM